MIIIGVDPGLVKTGYGLIDKIDNQIKYVASGVIKTDASNPIGKRLLNIYHELNEIIKIYNPQEFAIEETFVNDNPLTSLKLGHARGAAILVGAINNLHITEYSPNLIKKTITGAGKADKTQIQKMIKYILPISTFKTSDEADALAIAICHCNHMRKF
jgi:crossover junction endodeoxyribonuclease RuvC